MSIDNAHINGKPQQILPPFMQFTANGLVGMLVIHICAAHVFVLRLRNQDSWHLNNRFISLLSVCCLIPNWIRPSTKETY